MSMIGILIDISKENQPEMSMTRVLIDKSQKIKPKMFMTKIPHHREEHEKSEKGVK